jgi:hypothetical protein
MKKLLWVAILCLVCSGAVFAQPTVRSIEVPKLCSSLQRGESSPVPPAEVGGTFPSEAPLSG